MSASSDPIIQFDHATFGFPGVIALKDLSLAIQAGEFIGVIGPNGSGKTTLCKAVLGLMAPVEGNLRIFDCACDELRCHHRARAMTDPRLRHDACPRDVRHVRAAAAPSA